MFLLKDKDFISEGVVIISVSGYSRSLKWWALKCKSLVSNSLYKDFVRKGVTAPSLMRPSADYWLMVTGENCVY